MAEPIHESGMEFISENAFYIEKSPQYRNDLQKKEIRTVELVRVRENALLFIEAKTMFPNPNNLQRAEQFETQIHKIGEKFVHSLNLYASIALGITEEGFPQSFEPSKKFSLQFILVIKDYPPGWCKSAQHKLRSVLPPYIKRIWKPQVLVINHQSAKKYQLTEN